MDNQNQEELCYFADNVGNNSNRYAAYNLGDLKREEEVLLNLYTKVSFLDYLSSNLFIYALPADLASITSVHNILGAEKLGFLPVISSEYYVSS